jgi:hypothetical protein
MDEKWIWASAAVIGGLVLGSIVRFVVRRLLDHDGRRPAVREVAGPASVFGFWLVTATGILLAVAVSSPETLRPVPRDLLDWVPNAAVAGLFLIGGYALGLTVAAGVGGVVARTSGRRRRWLERGVRTAIFVGAGILAMDQIGVDTTILQILIAAAAGGAAAALAGIVVVGSRTVASDIAAGRVLQQWLADATIRTTDVSGTVTELGVTHVVVEDDSGGRRLVPYSRLVDQVIELVEPAT